jgi:ATP-dependent Clp protease ATP-binding subunit ClpA
MGARPLARKIDELIRVPLSKKILFEQIKNSNIMVQLEEDTISFMVTQKTIAMVDENGFIKVQD